MELACEIGSLRADVGVVLELDTDGVLGVLRVSVVKAIKEPVELKKLEGRGGEVLGIEEMVEELLRLEDGMVSVLEVLPRLEDGLYSEDDAGDEVLRFDEELTGGGCSSGGGCRCLGGPLILAVGNTRDV